MSILMWWHLRHGPIVFKNNPLLQHESQFDVRLCSLIRNTQKRTLSHSKCLPFSNLFPSLSPSHGEQVATEKVEGKFATTFYHRKLLRAKIEGRAKKQKKRDTFSIQNKRGKRTLAPVISTSALTFTFEANFWSKIELAFKSFAPTGWKFTDHVTPNPNNWA